MNKLRFSLAVAAMTCAAAGLSGCKDDKKPADTAAPAATTAPAPAAEPAKPTEPPAMAPAAPAPDKKSEAPAAPASDKMAAATPPAAAPEAPKAADPAPAPAAPKAEEAKPADVKPAETAAAPAAAPAETKTADAKPADAAPAAAAPDAAAPAGDVKDRTSPPDPVSEMAKQQGFKFADARYRNKDGDPQPVVTKDFMVDWGTWNGFRRYHDACHVCHGPNANGSTFAPALKESLKTIDYSTFVATVSGGKQENRGGTMFVMPSFGTDKNIMCYLDDIYTYIKARSLNDASGGKEGLPAGRPNGREDITDEAKKAADECTG